MGKTKKPQKPQQPQKRVGGPFLAAALFCEGILEAGGNKVSALGIMDGRTFWISPDAPPDVPSESQPLVTVQHILLIFRSGDSPGKHQLRLVLEQPSGKRATVLEKEIALSEPPHGGSNVRTEAAMAVHATGVYWMDVYLDGKRLTRMPMNIAIQRLPPPTAAAKR